MDKVAISASSGDRNPRRRGRVARSLRRRQKVAGTAARQDWLVSEASKVLYLGANPPGTAPLELYDEVRVIKRELRAARHRCFELVSYWASEPEDVIRELRESRPLIAHLSGHTCLASGPLPGHGVSRDMVTDAACERGLVLHARNGAVHVVPYEMVAKMFELAGSSVKLVVLTACATEPLARQLLAHVDCVVSMEGPVTDQTAIVFSKGFYAALGDGASVEHAYQAGALAIQCARLPGADCPKLEVRDGVDASQIVLAVTPPDCKTNGHKRPARPTARPSKRAAKPGALPRRGKPGTQRAVASGLGGKRNRSTRR